MQVTCGFLISCLLTHQGIAGLEDKFTVTITVCRHPASQQEQLFSAQDYISGDRFVVQRCAACNLVRTTPSLSLDQMSRYYPQGYYGDSQRYNVFLERMLNFLYSSRTRKLEGVHGAGPGDVLDIGCGRGQLLNHLRLRGWKALGTELSDDSARYARTVLHLDVRTANISDLHLPGCTFDAIILWHVLEHITVPGVLLGEVARLLRPGGTVLVAVPNFGSLEARLAGPRWFHLDVPRHATHHTVRSLRAMLRAAELHPCATTYFAIEYDFFSFVQTTLNMLGLRHNLLYNLLRSSGAKVFPQQQWVHSRRFHTFLTLLLTPPLGIMSLIWVPLVALIGQGATVTVYAKKKSYE